MTSPSFGAYKYAHTNIFFTLFCCTLSVEQSLFVTMMMMMMDFGNDKEASFSLSCLILSTIDDKLKNYGGRVEKKEKKKTAKQWRNVEVPLRLQLFYGLLKAKAEFLLEYATIDSRQEASPLHGKNLTMHLESPSRYVVFIVNTSQNVANMLMKFDCVVPFLENVDSNIPTVTLLTVAIMLVTSTVAANSEGQGGFVRRTKGKLLLYWHDRISVITIF